MVILILLILGVPIAFAIGITSVVALWMLDIDLIVLAQRLIAGTRLFPLLAIPGFILAGDLISSGGLSARLMLVADRMVWHVTGGMGMVSVLSSMFFACLSGSTPATTATIGKIMIPEMEKRGYSKRFATSLIVINFAVGMETPPLRILPFRWIGHQRAFHRRNYQRDAAFFSRRCRDGVAGYFRSVGNLVVPQIDPWVVVNGNQDGSFHRF